jgi:outer membrane protein OmpA-like peptidoglycan-associated protein
MNSATAFFVAYVYSDGKFHALSTPGGPGIQAYDINSGGVIVGSLRPLSESNRISHAMVWRDGKSEDLNSLVDGNKLIKDGKKYVLRVATSIGDQGEIVGDASIGETPDESAVFILMPHPSVAAPSAEALAQSLKDVGAAEIYDILFEFDMATIRPESEPTLVQIAKLLKSDPSLKLEVSGHTDNVGSAQHNLVLSDKRAKAVVNALITSYGIAADRLQSKGYGDARPVAPNDTEANRAKNRRVELRKS